MSSAVVFKSLALNQSFNKQYGEKAASITELESLIKYFFH